MAQGLVSRACASAVCSIWIMTPSIPIAACPPPAGSRFQFRSWSRVQCCPFYAPPTNLLDLSASGVRIWGVDLRNGRQLWWEKRLEGEDAQSASPVGVFPHIIFNQYLTELRKSIGNAHNCASREAVAGLRCIWACATWGDWAICGRRRGAHGMHRS